MKKNKTEKRLEKFNDQEFRRILMKTIQLKDSAEVLIPDIRPVFNKFMDMKSSDEGYEEMREKLEEKCEIVFRMMSLETNALLLHAVHKGGKAFALEFVKELEKEYEVKTASEKSLVQGAVSAFCRMMRFSELISRNAGNYRDMEDIRFMEATGKEIDRAQRQYLTYLQMLEHKKSPPMKVNVKAQTAFVAQNQQNISHSGKPNEKLNDRL